MEQTIQSDKKKSDIFTGFSNILFAVHKTKPVLSSHTGIDSPLLTSAVAFTESALGSFSLGTPVPDLKVANMDIQHCHAEEVLCRTAAQQWLKWLPMDPHEGADLQKQEKQ